jgi:Fe-S oxidoreductase
MYGEDLVSGFREFKHIWDPAGRMNPGKVVEPYRLDQNLRLGAGFRSAEPDTHFRFPDDRGSFGRATLRCVSVGKCRHDDGGTMCPSYMVTHDEQHTTRGRAHALFEMLQGGALKGGWKDEHVKDALDLCLACKGCKHDCPVNVDMATYKAEFLAHYYDGRLRPRAAYAMGLIMVWARLAALAPGLVNAVGQSNVLGRLVKRLGGVAPERRLPRFAPRTFKSWFFARPERPAGGKEVILFADTFNNHFRPETAMAAVHVLEDAGFHVRVPRPALCCGRPLYDYGMLPRAKRNLRRILDELRPALAVGTPVIGLEPSCLAVFRDEAVQLLPEDDDARRLKDHAVTLGELLAKEAPGWSAPRLAGSAVVHGHCHHKSVLDFESDTRVLVATGLDTDVVESGCCGMAGSFGYEPDHYEVSMACGERKLLPAVRRVPDSTLVVADGFSCRSQIEDATPRRTLHLAEVLYLARSAAGTPLGALPERRLRLGDELRRGARARGALAIAGLGVAAGAAIWLARRRR